MSDKLEWKDKHIIFFKHSGLKDMIEQEGYVLDENLEELAKQSNDDVFVFLELLEKNKLFKQACDFLVYALHKRVMIWWLYSCELELLKELKELDKESKDKKDDNEFTMPQWFDELIAKAKDNAQETQKEFEKKQGELEAEIEKLKARHKELEAQVEPEILAEFNSIKENIYKEIEKETGIYLPKYQEELIEKAKNPVFEDEYENSDLKKEMDKLKAKLDENKKEIEEQLELYFPKKDEAKHKARINNALNSIYAWIVSPDEENSKKVFESASSIEGDAEGLLALSTFYAYGNLNLEGELFVKAPNALVSNTAKAALVKLSLEKGERKPKQRYELFFKMGLDIAYGKDNWEESLSKDKAPHELILMQERKEVKNARFRGDENE